jgi:hypothetical protein
MRHVSRLVRSRRFAIALGLFVGLVVFARLLAPHYVLMYVNRTLNGLDGYGGQVDDVELHIWRGAYEIDGVRIHKESAHHRIPLLELSRMDISVHWDALLQGSLVGEIELFSPKLNFVADKGKEPAQEAHAEKRDARRASHGESTWQTQVKKLVPLKINRVGIYDGQIHFRDPYRDPKVNIFVRDFYGEVTNLTNSADLSNSMVASAHFRGRAMQSGRLKIDAKVDPYQKTPTFSLSARLEDLEMKQLNDFLKAYANVDAEAGRISVYTQVAAAHQHFKGYVKPLIRNLTILRWRDEKEGFFGKVWEGLVGAAATLFENQRKDQIATKIPMSGKLESPDTDVLETVIYVLKNAFIEALKHGFDEKAHLGAGLSASAGHDDAP